MMRLPSDRAPSPLVRPLRRPGPHRPAGVHRRTRPHHRTRPRHSARPPHRTSPGRLRATATFLLLVPVLLGGCETEEPALRVDGVGYEEEEILDYGLRSRRALAAITAVGVSVSTGDTLRPARPVLEAARREALVRRLREEALLGAADVDEEVLRAHYRTDPEHELTVRHLVVLSERSEDEASRAEARRRAEAALERIRAGEPFERVAAEVSEEPGAGRRGGLLEPGREGTWVDEFWRAAEALEVGGVSPVVETRYGFHVLRLEGRDTVPFEEARPRVVREVASLLPADPAAAAALEDSVVGRIEVHRERLARWREAWDPWQDHVAEAAEAWRCPDEPPLSSDMPSGAGLGDAPAAADSDVDPDADGASASDAPVASWSGGGVDHCELRRHLATLPYGRWREVTGSDEALAAEAETLARSVALARAARERGLDVPEAALREVRGEWTERMRRWAAVLGFQRRMPPAGLRATALAALGASGQEHRVVRDEIRERIPLLLHAYVVRFGDPASAD